MLQRMVLTFCLLLPMLSFPENSTDSAAEAELMFVGDFERGHLQPYGDSQLEHTLKKVSIVDEPVRAGDHALRLTLDRSAHQELKPDRTDFWIKGMSRSFKLGSDYWYGFSTFLPPDWKPDTQSELFVQWVGATPNGPSLAIYIYGDTYVIKKRWGAGRKDYQNLWEGRIPADTGRWVDWVFHVKWSPDDSGRIEVWKDEERIAADKGPNCGSTAEFGPYFKFGIYKWPWQLTPENAPSTVTRRVMLIDEIRIAAGKNGYKTVSPPETAEALQ